MWLSFNRKWYEPTGTFLKIYIYFNYFKRTLMKHVRMYKPNDTGTRNHYFDCLVIRFFVFSRPISHPTAFVFCFSVFQTRQLKPGVVSRLNSDIRPEQLFLYSNYTFNMRLWERWRRTRGDGSTLPCWNRHHYEDLRLRYESNNCLFMKLFPNRGTKLPAQSMF